MQSLSVDWFQVNLHREELVESGLVYPYHLKRMPFSTRVFENVFEVYDMDKKIGTLCNKPLTPIIDRKTHIFKLENSVLYQSQWYIVYFNFMCINKFIFHSFTRIDICCDFHTFENNLQPQNLISGYCAKKYLKVGKSKMLIAGKSKCSPSYEYIRFGTRDAACVVYLYNKTIEMREKTFKPYILETWQKNGYENKKDVWRLEFSITHFNVQSLVKSTGEVDNVNFENLRFKNGLHEIYSFYLKKYFRFKYNKNTKNITEMQTVNLLSNMATNAVISNKFDKLNSNRADRMFLSKMIKLNNEIRETKKDITVDENELITYLTNSRNLEQYKRHLQA